MSENGRDDVGDETRVLVERDGNRRTGTPEEVSISTLDRGFLYGDGVFETLRCYDGTPAFTERHASRLNEALGATGIHTRFEASGIEERASSVTDGFAGDAYVRLTVTRGEREGLLAPTETGSTVVVHASPLDRRRYPPVAAETVTEPRPLGTIARHKTMCYLPNALARSETTAEADEAIMSADGTVASGAVSNAFVLRDGRIETPDKRIRKGVTRDVVLELADERGYETHTGETTLEDAEAVFLTNTTWGVRPVEVIDEASYDTEHPVLEELADAYLSCALRSADADRRDS